MNIKRNFKYTFVRMVSELRSLVLLSIPIVIIILIFILSFTAYKEGSVKSFEKFFSGLSEQAIIMQSQSLKATEIEKLDSQQILTNIDGSRLNFSEQDLSIIRNIKGVQSASLSLSSVKSAYDQDKDSLNLVLTQSDLPKEIRHYFKGDSQSVTLNFEALTVNEEAIKHYNMENIQLYAGDFPKDNTNQVIIPDFYAKSLIHNGDLENLVGEKIKLLVNDIELEKEATKFEKEYIIAGIYNSKIEDITNLEYPIYVSYFPQANEVDNKYIDDAYSFFSQTFSENVSTKKYTDNIMKDKEAFKEALGTGYDQIVIVVGQKSDVIHVEKEVQDLFPKHHLISQNDIKNGELSNIYKKLQKVLILGSLLITIIMGLVIIFINKGYVNNRSYELSILYCQGYSKKEILLIIVVENMVLYSIYTFLAFLIAFLFRQFLFDKTRHYWMFTGLFEISNILVICLLISIVVIISIVWGILGINRNNILKHINSK